MSTNDKNSGYSGYSMSRRAVAAEEAGAFPLSHWTKAAILDAIEDPEVRKKAATLTVAELRDQVLVPAGYHHMGKFAKAVDFYTVEQPTSADALIHTPAKRTPKAEKPKETDRWMVISWTAWEGNYRRWRKPVEHTAVAHLVGDTSKATIADRDGDTSRYKLSCRVERELPGRPAKDDPVWDEVTD